MQNSFTDILFSLRRYKSALLVYCLCLAVVFGVYLFAAKKTYSSRATLLVRFSQDYSSQLKSEEMQNEIRFLTSKDALRAVASMIGGPQTSHRDVRKIGEYLGRNLKASVVPNSGLIEISFDFPDAMTAQKVLRTLLAQYRDHRAQIGHEPHQKFSDLAESGYLRAQEALDAFEKTHNLFDERQLGVLHESREQLQLVLNSLDNEYAYALRKKNYIQEMLRDMPKEFFHEAAAVPNEQYAVLAERLAKAKTDLSYQLLKHVLDGQAVARLEEEVSGLEAAIANEPKKIPDPDEAEGRLNEARDVLHRQLLDLMPETEAQKARIESLRRQVAEIDEALVANAEEGEEYASLQAVRDQKKMEYEQSRGNFHLSPGAQEGYSPNFQVSLVEFPSYNPDPLSPAPGPTLALGIVLLLAGGGALLPLCSLMDSTVLLARQARERFRLPVFETREAQSAETAESARQPYYEKHVEMFLQLYRHLIISADPPPKSVLFTSAGPATKDGVLPEAFADFVKHYYQRKPVLVRYLPPADQREKAAPEGKKPAVSSSGVTIYERAHADPANERALWEELYKDKDIDIVIIEYELLRQNTLLPALGEYADVAVISVLAGKSDKKAVEGRIATLQHFGVPTACLVLRNTGFSPVG